MLSKFRLGMRQTTWSEMLGRLLHLAKQSLLSFLPMTKNDDLLKKHTLPPACFSRIVLTPVPKGDAGLLGLIRTFFN